MRLTRRLGISERVETGIRHKWEWISRSGLVLVNQDEIDDEGSIGRPDASVYTMLVHGVECIFRILEAADLDYA